MALNSMLNSSEVARIYKNYGFKLEVSNNKNILVFTLQNGHYHNADIINTGQGKLEEIKDVFDNFTRMGFACKIRDYKNNEEVQKGLFDGFFSVKNTKKYLDREYNNHVSQILDSLPENSEYNYINTTYKINNKVGESTVIREITDRLSEKKPILFLIEAAAGFGKTCTAYELLVSFTRSDLSIVPLFSELSRNRQAKIFHYVLLDEIDRSFPSLQSSLVKEQIKSGKVPVILDGFDELLLNGKMDEESLEQAYNMEPMLNTISELLIDSAKIVLTTRRTAIFDGDDFHEWVNQHVDKFEIIRIKLNEPTISEWLPASRLEKLNRVEFPIQKLNNPVLLSYLRFISENEFDQFIQNPEEIVERYFKTMFERERKRQDLMLLPEQQYKILKEIAEYFISNNCTSEQKEVISNHIQRKFTPLLEESRRIYSAENRPTLEELLNKLTSHALLDRATNAEANIGFVNEFVLGNFVSDIIQESNSSEWLGDEIFIEPAILAATPKSKPIRQSLWNALQFFLDLTDRPNLSIPISIKLTGSINFALKENSASSLNIENILIGESPISDFLFMDCIFFNCIFDNVNLTNVTFSNCKFYNCQYTNESDSIYEVGCLGNNDDVYFSYITNLNKSIEVENQESDDIFQPVEIYILEKFWPVGSTSSFKHRHHNKICSLNHQFKFIEIILGIKSLRKRKILLEPDKTDFYELNYDHIIDIKTALGR